MDIAILGTGAVGRALGRGFTAAGHQVILGTRDPEQTRAAARSGRMSTSTWPRTPTSTAMSSSTRPTAPAPLAALRAVGGALDGKVVIDTSNPLDFSQGFPAVAVRQQHRLPGRAAAAELPNARLVKSFNTMSNPVMINPGALPAETTIFVAGNDQEARRWPPGCFAISAGPTSSTSAT